MNKVLYAREGAKSIMDRTFADFPWQVRVEVDGLEIEVPEVSMLIILFIFCHGAAASNSYIKIHDPGTSFVSCQFAYFFAVRNLMQNGMPY